jgi:formate hydrogenlyase subunit 6/NADH:ubiquinone oxidoreductase subunit I
MKFKPKVIGVMFEEVARSLFKKPVTERYPFERRPVSERYRGRLVYDPGKCVGCQLCVKDCPSEAIHLVVLDKTAKRFVIRYHTDRCTYCGQCVESCRFGCLAMSKDLWELASTHRDRFTLFFGCEEDVRFVQSRADTRFAEGPSED